jgi:hypothetical protein
MQLAAAAAAASFFALLSPAPPPPLQCICGNFYNERTIWSLLQTI